MQKSKNSRAVFTKRHLLESFYPNSKEIETNKVSSFELNGSDVLEAMTLHKTLPLNVYFGDLLINSNSRVPVSQGISPLPTQPL